MKILSLKAIDSEFFVADIETFDGIISLEAEMFANRPIHIERANWKDSGRDASPFVCANLKSIEAIFAVMPR